MQIIQPKIVQLNVKSMTAYNNMVPGKYSTLPDLTGSVHEVGRSECGEVLTTVDIGPTSITVIL